MWGIALYLFLVLSGILLFIIIYSNEKRGKEVKIWQKILSEAYLISWIGFTLWIVWIAYKIGMVR